MNVLITGASGNLGKCAVERFLAEGYTVITTVSPGKSLGFATEGELHVFEADLTNEMSAHNTVAQIIAKHGTIDAALLLVGGYASGSINETDSNLIKKMLALNFDTAYHVAQPVFQQMLMQPHGGRMVLVGSRPALNPQDGKKSLAYALSKSLIFSLAEILNAEGSDKNVVSSVIVPSTMDTPANRAAMPHADFSTWVKPEEIAEAMLYLASEKGRALRDTVLKLYANS